MKKKIILNLAMAALLSIFVLGCNRTERLYIFSWTYYLPDTIIEKFENEFNVRIILDTYASNEEMLARLLATFRPGRRAVGRQYDIVFPSGDFVPIMITHGMLERIDHSLLQNMGNIDPIILNKSADPYMEYSVPYFYGAAGIIVNTARVPEFERSWSIFAREDLAGRMTMLDDLREVIGGALLYLGYSVNSTDPDQIHAARDLINNYWRPNLVRFDAEAFGIGFASGDFWVVHGFPEVVFEEIAGNAQLLQDTYFFIPQEGGVAYIDSMVILRGSQNVELAHKFIDFIHRPEIYAAFVDFFDFPATVNVPARELTTSASPLFTVEQLYETELVHYLGPEAVELFHDVWFNSIRIGR